MATPPSSIPWLAMGSWLLCIGWFGFNVMSAQRLEAVSGLVAINSLMAMCGGIVVALIVGDNDPGFVHNGALAGLVAVCAGSDVMHPLGALVVGGVAGAIFVQMFQISTNKWKIDDVLGVWALHGLCGLWGGVACGIFGLEVLGGLGGVTFAAQLVGSLAGVAFGFRGWDHCLRHAQTYRWHPTHSRRGTSRRRSFDSQYRGQSGGRASRLKLRPLIAPPASACGPTPTFRLSSAFFR